MQFFGTILHIILYFPLKWLDFTMWSLRKCLQMAEYVFNLIKHFPAKCEEHFTHYFAKDWTIAILNPIKCGTFAMHCCKNNGNFPFGCLPKCNIESRYFESAIQCVKHSEHYTMNYIRKCGDTIVHYPRKCLDIIIQYFFVCGRDIFYYPKKAGESVLQFVIQYPWKLYRKLDLHKKALWWEIKFYASSLWWKMLLIITHYLVVKLQEKVQLFEKFCFCTCFKATLTTMYQLSLLYLQLFRMVKLICRENTNHVTILLVLRDRGNSIIFRRTATGWPICCKFRASLSMDNFHYS